jgi:parvulin-like peptidyl-prolyl isomerase
MKLLTLAIWIVIALAVVVPAGLVACGGDDGGASPGADAVAARVDGRPIPQSAVDLASAEARFAGVADDAGRALEAAIDRELLRAEAQRRGLVADEAEVESRLTAVTEQFGGVGALKSALEKAGMTASQLRESLRAGVLREAVQDARFSGVEAGSGAAHRFYERKRDALFTEAKAVKLAALVVRNEGIAGNAIKRLRQGRPFSEVSRQFSIDPQIKDAGGMLGWLDPRSLPEPLRKAVERLPVGRISPPVAGPGGTWVFDVVARRPERVAPFARVRDQIKDGLTGRLRSAALDKWLTTARKDAAIERL